MRLALAGQGVFDLATIRRPLDESGRLLRILPR
jgi:hypothetical protein